MITKTQMLQIRVLCVNDIPIADKIAPSGSAATFWCRASEEFPPGEPETYANWLANAIETHLPEVQARVVEVGWDDGNEAHIAKLSFNAVEVEPVNPAPCV